MARFCQHCNEPLNSTTFFDILKDLGDSWFLEKDSASWILVLLYGSILLHSVYLAYAIAFSVCMQPALVAVTLKQQYTRI